MKNLIIKTAAVTFACIVLCFSVLYGALVLISPSTLAGFYKNTGADSVALRYAELAYNKSPAYDTAYAAAECAVDADNSQATVKYCDIVLKSGKLPEDEVNYFAINYVSALYFTGDGDGAINAAFLYVDGYSSFNPVRSLISGGIQSNDGQFLNKLLVKLSEYALELPSGAAKNLCASDISVLSEYLAKE